MRIFLSWMAAFFFVCIIHFLVLNYILAYLCARFKTEITVYRHHLQVT